MKVLLTLKNICGGIKMDRTSIVPLAIGVVVGAAIGAALGILYAPKSGKETRAQIKDKASEVIEKTKDKASEIIEKAKDKASDIRHTVACKIDKDGENC
jgi:gas vesicle protein